MADRKSGPVKPPVIDLKARDASEPAATDDSKTGSDAPSKSATAAKRAGRSAAKPAPAEPSDATEESARSEPPVAEAAPPTPEAPEVNEASSPRDDEPASAPPDEPASAAPDEPAPAEPDAEPAAAAAPEPEPAQAPIPPRPPARLAMPWSAISIATAGGGVLGALLTYLAANWIALPQQQPPYPDPTEALTTLADRAADLETRLAAVEQTARTTQVSLDATLVQMDTAVAELRQSLDDLLASIPAAQEPVDLSAIEAELQTLESRVGAIAAGASSADAAALAESLVGIEQTLATLASRIDGLDGRLGTATSDVGTLRAELEGAKAAIAAQTRTLGGAEIGPAVKLPLIVSGLEAAFASGRPYTAELDGLTALLPDIEVPDAVATNAATGLPRPDALAARFTAVLPDILAGRIGETTGDWAQDAVEWAKALLALRPAEEMEGTTPEAIVSRLEGAVARRDFIAAAALLAQLPAPMRQAAGEVGTDIVAQAEAMAFVGELRTQALAPAAEPAN